MISDILYQVGQQLDTFHEASVTTTSFRVLIDNGVPVFHLVVPELNGITAEFRDGASVVAFLTNMNAGINKESAIVAIKELEVLKAEQIVRDAKIVDLEKTIKDLPETQILTDAMAEADRIKKDAEERLAKLAEAVAAAEAEAAAKQAEADAAELAVPVKEIK